MQSATGGVYIPPFRLRQMQLENQQKTDQASAEHQRAQWDLLRKKINGTINKVNLSNIQRVVLQLFNCNLIRGKGLFARSVLKAQVASVNYSHIFAALVAVVNSKLPDVVRVLLNRLILQFKKAYRRANKIQCVGSLRFIAALVNQQVLHEIIALEILALLLENPTEDSIDLACAFMTECGKVLTEITPQGTNAIFERFRSLLQNGQVNRRCQYLLEKLFKVRKDKYAEHPGVVPELDLVEEGDRITHEISLDDEEVDGKKAQQMELDVFALDEKYEQHEAEWDEIRLEILGEEMFVSLQKEEEEMARRKEESEGENPEEPAI